MYYLKLVQKQKYNWEIRSRLCCEQYLKLRSIVTLKEIRQGTDHRVKRPEITVSASTRCADYTNAHSYDVTQKCTGQYPPF